MNLVSELFGTIALIIYAISFQATNRKKLLKLLITCNIFYLLQYLMLNSYSAVFACVIGVSRSLIFSIYEKQNKKPDYLILIILISLAIFSGFISYNGIISLIPIMSSILCTISVWQSDMKVYGILNLIASSSWIIYNIVVGAYVGIISGIVEIISEISCIIKSNKVKKTNK